MSMPNWPPGRSSAARLRIRWYGRGTDWRHSTTFLRVADMPPGMPLTCLLFVLLDLNIPKVSGFEVLVAIRADERTRHLPVIVLSSSGEDRDLMRAYKHFANSYIIKPLDYDQFVMSARQLSLYWTELNEPPPLIVSATSDAI
jgi:CheY-like chemotaxis protein